MARANRFKVDTKLSLYLFHKLNEIRPAKPETIVEKAISVNTLST